RTRECNERKGASPLAPTRGGVVPAIRLHPLETAGALMRRDPLANPAPLIRRVYSYVAYRIGDGPDAEDVTSEVFERALRYRGSYDPSRGEPLAWLIGIARRCIDDAVARPRAEGGGQPDLTSAEDLEAEAVQRLTV